jgi:hypothetical protein
MRVMDARCSCSRVAAVAWALAGALVLAAAAEAQEPAGAEFQVNTYTTGDQRRVAIAAQPDGKFMVVWDSVGDGNQLGVFSQVYDASGAAIGGQQQVNTHTIGAQWTPAVAALGNGGFVVVWDDVLADASGSAVLGRRMSSAGTPASLEFAVNTYWTGNQKLPRVAGSANGFAVLWNSQDQDGSKDGIFGQCFDLTNTRVGGEFQVNTYTTQYQRTPDVAMNASGAFVVAWTDSTRGHTYAQRYAPGCTRAGAEFQAHDSASMPAVGMDAAGGFVVAGAGPPVGGGPAVITAQRYDAAGVPQGGPFLVNTYTTATGFQEAPHVSMESSGDFVVSWDTYNLTTPFGVTRESVRAFRATGTPAGPEFLANTYTTTLRAQSVVATDEDGDFVVAWTGADAAGYGIKAQRYLPSDLIFADGFNAGNLSAWSSASIGAGDLVVDAAAAMASTPFGIDATANGTAGLFVQDDSPTDENRYHARFYFDPNGFDPGTAQAHLRTRIFIGFEQAPNRRLFAVVLKKQSGQYSLMGRVRRDDNVQLDTGFFPISDGPHYVEIDWKRSSAPDAVDGSFELSIDGASVSLLTGLDTSVSSVDFARMGALSVKTGAFGSMYWDEFESRRRTEIGPVP